MKTSLPFALLTEDGQLHVHDHFQPGSHNVDLIAVLLRFEPPIVVDHPTEQTFGELVVVSGRSGVDHDDIRNTVQDNYAMPGYDVDIVAKVRASLTGLRGKTTGIFEKVVEWDFVALFFLHTTDSPMTPIETNRFTSDVALFFNAPVTTRSLEEGANWHSVSLHALRQFINDPSTTVRTVLDFIEDALGRQVAAFQVVDDHLIFRLAEPASARPYSGGSSRL